MHRTIERYILRRFPSLREERSGCKSHDSTFVSTELTLCLLGIPMASRAFRWRNHDIIRGDEYHLP